MATTPTVNIKIGADGSQAQDTMRKLRHELKEIGHEGHLAAKVIGGGEFAKFAKFGALAAGGLGIGTGITVAIAGIEKLADVIKESNEAWRTHIKTVDDVAEAYNVSFGVANKFLKEVVEKNLPMTHEEKEKNGTFFGTEGTKEHEARVKKATLDLNKALAKVIEEGRKHPESSVGKTLESLGLKNAELAPGNEAYAIGKLRGSLGKMSDSDQYFVLTKLFKEQAALFRDVLSTRKESMAARHEREVSEEVERLKSKYTVLPTGREPEPTMPYRTKTDKQIDEEARINIGEKEQKLLGTMRQRALLEVELEESVLKYNEKQKEQLSDQDRLNELIEKENALLKEKGSLPKGDDLGRSVIETQIVENKTKQLELQTKIQESEKKHEQKLFESSLLDKSKEDQIKEIQKKMLESQHQMNILPIGSKERNEARDEFEKYQDQLTKSTRDKQKAQFELDTHAKEKAFEMGAHEFTGRASGRARVGGFAGTNAGAVANIQMETNNILRMIHRVLLQKYQETTFNLDQYSLH